MKKFALLLLMLSSATVWGQRMIYKGFPSLIWPKLYDISFVTEKDRLGDYEKPIFSDAVKALQNKSVVLPGYMVPLEGQTGSGTIMLSSLPLNACFFCGVGGLETVVEVHLKNKTSYIEKPIEVRGILRLNDKDPDKMIYVLEDAEILGKIEF